MCVHVNACACACLCVCVCLYKCVRVSVSVFIVPVQLSDVKLLASLTGFVVVVALPVKLLSLGK